MNAILYLREGMCLIISACKHQIGNCPELSDVSFQALLIDVLPCARERSVLGAVAAGVVRADERQSVVIDLVPDPLRGSRDDPIS